MDQAIHKNIVAIVWIEPKYQSVGRGSGLLISRNLVLTCSHNFFTKSLERVSKDFISIYPGLSGKLVSPYKVESIYIPRNFQPLVKTV